MTNQETMDALLKALSTMQDGEAFYKMYYSEDAKSIESPSETMPQVYEGLDAILAKSKGWYDTFEVTHFEILHRSVLSLDQMIVTAQMSMKNKFTGEEINNTKEYLLYTFKDGKIIEEKFFNIV